MIRQFLPSLVFLLLTLGAFGEPKGVVDNEETKSDLGFKRATTTKKMIALTFMGGPHPKNTPALLNVLKARKIRATFFVVGSSVDRYPEIAARIVNEGHEIGNLTMNHRNLEMLSDENLMDELKGCHAAISQATGLKPRLMRPPYGALTEKQRSLIEEKFGYEIVLWSIDPKDWMRPGANVVAESIVKQAHPGGIVLLHDLHKATIEAMPKAIGGLIGKDYKFATVSELMALDGKEEE